MDIDEKRLLESKRDKFYKAGEPLFERFGFKKTTVEEICKSAGVSKRTYYELFTDKGDLYARMLLNIAEEIFGKWETRSLETGSATEKLLSFIDTYTQEVVTRPVFKEVFANQEAFKAFGLLLGEMHFSPIVLNMHNIISEGVENGEFTKLNVDRSVWILLTLLDSIFLVTPAMMEDSIQFIDDKMKTELKRFIITGLGGKYDAEA